MRYLVLAVVALVLGIALGSTYANHSIRQHAPQLAVMWLADFHSQALLTALQGKNCNAAEQQLRRLHETAQQMALIFPKAVEQEAEFRRYLETLQQLTSPQPVVTGACTDNAQLSKRINDACEDCHRAYR